MKTAIIIEDEPDSRDILRNFLQKYHTGISLKGEAGNVREGISLINEHSPDLIFMDIHLPDGTGFDILDQCRPLRSRVLFLTAYDEYAIKAFKYSAVDYLLKPYDPMELMAAINRFISEQLPPAELINETLNENRHGLKKFALPTGEGIQMVAPQEIVRCEADNNYTLVFMKDGARIVLSKPLKFMEELLPENDFFRCHQSHLFNLNYLKQFSKQDGGTVVLENGASLPVARRKREELTKLLKSQ